MMCFCRVSAVVGSLHQSGDLMLVDMSAWVQHSIPNRIMKALQSLPKVTGNGYNANMVPSLLQGAGVHFAALPKQWRCSAAGGEDSLQQEECRVCELLPAQQAKQTPKNRECYEQEKERWLSKATAVVKAFMGAVREESAPLTYHKQTAPEHLPYKYLPTHAVHSAAKTALKKMFGTKGLKEAESMEDSSMNWVVKQTTYPYLWETATPSVASQLKSEAIVSVIPGGWIEHYSKDALCYNTLSLPDKLLNAVAFPCFVVPHHFEQLEHYSKSHPSAWFIYKQLAASSSIGTRLLTPTNFHKHRKDMSSINGIVQRYSLDVLLYDDRKVDFRVFVYIRTDPLRVYVHRDGWTWVAQSKWSTNTTSVLVHTTNTAQLAPGETIYSRRARRMSTWQVFARKYSARKWSAFWSKVQHSIASVVLSFAHKLGCKGLYQKPPLARLCGRTFQLYGVDVLPNAELTEAKVLEINNDPSVLQYLGLGSDDNEQAKRRMYETVYADTAVIAGFNPSNHTFQARDLTNEWDNRGGFELVYPPRSGNFSEFEFFQHHVEEDELSAYAGLIKHVSEKASSTNV